MAMPRAGLGSHVAGGSKSVGCIKREGGERRDSLCNGLHEVHVWAATVDVRAAVMAASFVVEKIMVSAGADELSKGGERFYKKRRTEDGEVVVEGPLSLHADV
jgi:hypothetical protein